MRTKLPITVFIILIVVPNYLRAQQYLSIATQKGKSGFVNENGKWQIEPEFDEVTGFAYGLAAVRTGDIWGYINRTGSYIIPAEFESAGPFLENGVARVQIEGSTYYLDLYENMIPEEDALLFNDGLALVRVDGKYGYIGRDLQWKIPPVFDKAWAFKNGNARVRRNNRWYYINKSGYEEFIPSRSRTYRLDEDQEALSRKNGKEKWGFTGIKGQWIIPPIFNYVKSFSEGLAPVRIGNKWGYINRKGAIVIDAAFEDACVFKNGLASVKLKGLYGCIDTIGTQIIKPKFDNPLYFSPLVELSFDADAFNADEPGIMHLSEIIIPEIQGAEEKIYTPEDKRLALVIGNSRYIAGGQLKNPEFDATDIADALRKLGFTVNILLNSSQLTMKRAIDEFGEQLKDFDVGLFFYAGHGIQADGYNYLIPVDAEIKSERDVEYSCVEAGRVLSRMEDSGNSANIVILDACRDNPFERSWSRNASGQGLAFMNAPSGSLIAYATAPGTTASDGLGENGLYTSSMLKHITTPGLSILELFQKVRSEVIKSSFNKQIPWESTSLEGNFYFIK